MNRPCYDKEKDAPLTNMTIAYVFDTYKSERIKVLLACVALSYKWFKIWVPCKFGALNSM